MKAVENILRGDNGGWNFEARVTAPRNSCASLLHFRRALTAILPGYSERIAGLTVIRLDNWREYRFVIRGNEVTLETAVGILDGRIPTPNYPRKKRTRKQLPLTDLPMFKEQAA